MPNDLIQHRPMSAFSPSLLRGFIHRFALLCSLALVLAAAVPLQRSAAAGESRIALLIAQSDSPAAPRKSPTKRKKGGETKTGAPSLPEREKYNAEEADAAQLPGIPNARFWGDSEADFIRALPTASGPWLALSSGGADGAFGAGLLVGLSAAGKRPDYALITGVSSGALMAPFVFAGAKYNERLREVYTTLNSGDVFEVNRTPESFFDTWPLKELIAKQVTPGLLADVAAEHAKGRRLFVVTSDLDAERPVAWNMGVIAAAGGETALRRFRDILLAAGSIPGAFPPVLIEVEAGGKRFREMHADGGMFAQFYVAPESLLASTSNYRLPASDLYVVINTQLVADFQVVDRSLVPIVVRGVSAIVKTLTRVMIDRAYVTAKRSGISFNLATVPVSFRTPSQGAFDTEYMKALFDVGFEQAKSATPFMHEPVIPSVRPNSPQR